MRTRHDKAPGHASGHFKTAAALPGKVTAPIAVDVGLNHIAAVADPKLDGGSRLEPGMTAPDLPVERDRFCRRGGGTEGIGAFARNAIAVVG